jgi:hypothetical protein
MLIPDTRLAESELASRAVAFLAWARILRYDYLRCCWTLLGRPTRLPRS